MRGLFLAPATDRKGSYGYFKKTVLEGVHREIYSDFLDEDQGEQVRMWRITSSLKPTWKNARKDDWVVFYTQENQYEYAIQISGKRHCPEFGNAVREEVLDDVSDERDWDYLLFLENPVPISVSGDTVAELLGYLNRFPVRFIRVTNERLEAVESKYHDVEGFIDAISE